MSVPPTPVHPPAVMAPPRAGDGGGIRAILFDGGGGREADAVGADAEDPSAGTRAGTEGRHQRALTLAQIDPATLDDTQLLWIDCKGLDGFDALADRLQLPAAIRDAVASAEAKPGLIDGDTWYWLRTVALRGTGAKGFEDVALDLVAARNVVVTLRRDPDTAWPPFDAPPGGEDGIIDAPSMDAAGLGRLDAGGFVAARLHHVLTTYFEAVAAVERHVERIDQRILDPRRFDCIRELRGLLRATSHIRRKLARHRLVFSRLARPDFRPSDPRTQRKHFAALEDKYERAIDAVENGRDLVVACFELFSSHTALATNETMRRLTFLTMLIGVMSVTAGIFGMNFKMPFFESTAGFWITLGAMGAVTVAAIVVGKLGRWL